jgi:CRP-like cAMP-binding protein
MVSVELLKRYPLFAGLSADQLRQIAGISHEAVYEPGEWIVREGEPADHLYVITGGHVDVCVNLGFRDRRCMNISTITVGDLMGWSALVGERRAASTRARTTVHAIAISGRGLKRLFQDDMMMRCQFMEQVTRVMHARLRAMQTQFASVLCDWSAYVRYKNAHTLAQPEPG